MSRVTVIHEGRSFRCSPEVARAYIERGAKLDAKDERGSEAYQYFMRNRKPPTKKRRKTKDKGVTDAS